MEKKSIRKLEFLMAIAGSKYSYKKGALAEIGNLIDAKEAERFVKAGIAKYVSEPVAKK